MENNPGLKNRQLEVLITRLFIRYVTRLFGYCNASAIFSKFVYLLRKLFGLNFDNYSMYILQINIFRNICFGLFIKEDILEHKKQKKK